MASESGERAIHGGFICYSRKDKAFVQRLDEEGIRSTEELMQAIYSAIGGTDTFLFVLSPGSVSSVVCGKEIAHAASQNKRMIPLVARDVDAAQVPEALAKLNWIFCRELDDFGQVSATLINALDTDLDWVRAHTRLLTRAVEWEGKGKNNSFVLRGDDLREAERWLTEAGADIERQPTALQTEYIIASRKAAARRQRITLGPVGLGAVIAIVLAIIAFVQRGEARNQRDAAVNALSQSDFAQGTRLIEDGKSAQALAYLARAVRSNGNPAAATRIGSLLIDRVWPLPLPSKYPDAVRYYESPDGTRALVILADGTAEIRDGASSKALSPRILLRAGVDVAAFSPDGTRVAIAGDDQKDYSPHESATSAVQLWDAVNNTAVNDPVRFEGSYVDEKMFAFSENSRYLAINGLALGTPVWDAKTGRQLRQIAAPYGAQFSRDGERILTDWTGEVFETQTGKRVSSGTPHDATQRNALNPDGLRIAFARDTEIVICDVTTGKPVTPSLPVMDSRVNRLNFNPGGQWLLAIGGYDSRVWNARNGHPVTDRLSHPGNASISAALFSPDGYRVATVTDDGSVRVWNAGSGELQVESIEGEDIAEARFSHDGRCLITRNDRDTSQLTFDLLGAVARPLSLPGSLIAKYEYLVALLDDKFFRVWDIRSHILIEVKRSELGGSDYTASFSANGPRLMVRSESGLRFWDMPSPKELPPIPLSGAAELSRDGMKVLTTGKTVKLWDVEYGRLLHELKPADPTAEVDSARFLPDGNLIAISAGEKMQLYNIATGAPSSPPLPRLDAVSPDGARGITIQTHEKMEEKQEVRVWDVISGKPVGEVQFISYFSDNNDYIRELKFNPDGSRFIVSSEFGKVLLFETATGRQVGLGKEIGMYGEVMFSPDGKLFASSGDAMRIWSAETGAPLINPVYPPKGFSFNTVAFSSDGSRILLAGRQVCTLFDTMTGTMLGDFSSDKYQDVDESSFFEGRSHFSPDDLLIVEDLQNSVRVWNIPPRGKGPAWLADLAEAVSGCSLNTAGTVEILPDRAQRLVAIRGEVAKLPSEDPWAKVANWFLTAPDERTISPYSSVKVSDYVQRRISANTFDTLEEAVRTSPANPLARARFGVSLLQQPKINQNALVQADAETLFATRLAPMDPAVCEARARVLLALKRTAEAEAAAIQATALSRVPGNH